MFDLKLQLDGYKAIFTMFLKNNLVAVYLGISVVLLIIGLYCVHEISIYFMVTTFITLPFFSVSFVGAVLCLYVDVANYFDRLK
jgi:hypothetical protein